MSQVNTAISQMDKVTQANAANAEESASAAEELKAQSNNLRETVESMDAMVTGTAANENRCLISNFSRARCS